MTTDSVARRHYYRLLSDIREFVNSRLHCETDATIGSVDNDPPSNLLERLKILVDKPTHEEPAAKATDKQVGGSHYREGGIQPIDFIFTNKMNFNEGSAIKYIHRHRRKNGREDIQKAIHYLQILLEQEYPSSTPNPADGILKDDVVVCPMCGSSRISRLKGSDPDLRCVACDHKFNLDGG